MVWSQLTRTATRSDLSSPHTGGLACTICFLLLMLEVSCKCSPSMHPVTPFVVAILVTFRCIESVVQPSSGRIRKRLVTPHFEQDVNSGFQCLECDLQARCRLRNVAGTLNRCKNGAQTGSMPKHRAKPTPSDDLSGPSHALRRDRTRVDSSLRAAKITLSMCGSVRDEKKAGCLTSSSEYCPVI